MQRIVFTAVVTLILTLSGCAAGPKFETKDIDMTLTPSYAATHIDTLRDRKVVWGGIILTQVNLKDQTQIEILSYPLDSAQRPDIEAQATGRFVIIREGYLEPVDYAPGRLLSVSGSLQTTQSGKVGDVSYTYPVVRPDAIYLWRRSGGAESRVHFGVGVSISR